MLTIATVMQRRGAVEAMVVRMRRPGSNEFGVGGCFADREGRTSIGGVRVGDWRNGGEHSAVRAMDSMELLHTVIPEKRIEEKEVALAPTATTNTATSKNTTALSGDDGALVPHGLAKRKRMLPVVGGG